MPRRIRKAALEIYDFVVGDDWLLAVGVIVGPGLIQAGDGGPSGKGGDVILKAGDGVGPVAAARRPSANAKSLRAANAHDRGGKSAGH